MKATITTLGTHINVLVFYLFLTFFYKTAVIFVTKHNLTKPIRHKLITKCKLYNIITWKVHAYFTQSLFSMSVQVYLTSFLKNLVYLYKLQQYIQINVTNRLIQVCQYSNCIRYNFVHLVDKLAQTRTNAHVYYSHKLNERWYFPSHTRKVHVISHVTRVKNRKVQPQTIKNKLKG